MPVTPSPHDGHHGDASPSHSISDIVIDTSSSADSSALARPSFLFPSAPPRVSSRTSPLPAAAAGAGAPAGAAPRLLDPFTTPDGLQGAPTSYADARIRAQAPARPGPSRYAIPPSSPFSGATPGNVDARNQGISLLTTPAAPVSFPVYTTASTAAGRMAATQQQQQQQQQAAHSEHQHPQTQQRSQAPPMFVLPPAAPRRPVASSNREQFASTPESSFGQSSWMAHGRGHGHVHGHGHGLQAPLPSLDAAAQAEERRGYRAGTLDPFEASEDGGYESMAQLLQAQQRRVTFFPPAPYGQHGGQGVGPFETPSNVGMGIDERGVAFAQTRPAAGEASLSIHASSSYLSGTDTGTFDVEAGAAPSRANDDEDEADDADGLPPSPPPLMLRTWKGETVPVPSYLIQPDLDAASQSFSATEGVLDTFLGLRVFHGWYGYEHCNDTSKRKGAGIDVNDERAAEQADGDDDDDEESVVNLYDAFGRVRASVSTPKYHLRGGSKGPMPTPRESVALRRKAELDAVQRRNARNIRSSTPPSHEDGVAGDETASTIAAAAIRQQQQQQQQQQRKWKSTVRPWHSHRSSKPDYDDATAARRSKRQRSKVVEATMTGLRNALLAADGLDDWTFAHLSAQGRGTIYDPDDTESRSPSAARQDASGNPMSTSSVYTLESALPGVYL